jgi:hypothetical protein
MDPVVKHDSGNDEVESKAYDEADELYPDAFLFE